MSRSRTTYLPSANSHKSQLTSNLEKLPSSLLPAIAFFLAVIPAARAQQSNGLTFYHLAGASTTDSSGNALTSIKFGPQTNGAAVAFENGTGTTVCDSTASLYSVPITGGTVTTLVSPSLPVESTEPAGTGTVLCTHLMLGGSTLFYGANYTPTGGSLRTGIFKIPITGGTSTDVLATGDATPAENFTTASNVHVTQPGTVNTLDNTTFGLDPSSNLIANYTASFNPGGGPYNFNSYSLYGYPTLLGGDGLTTTSACTGVTVPLQGGPVSSGLTVGSESGYGQNVPWFADLTSGPGTNYAGVSVSSMQFLQISISPYFGGCQAVVFGPDLGSMTGNSTFILPGEPAPNTSTPVSSMVMNAVAVSNGVVYLSANQQLSATQGSYSGIFTVADNFTGANGSSGAFPLPNGTWPSNENPIPTKIVSNYDPIPGITLGVTSCSGTGAVSQIPTIGNYFTVNGNYLVFSEVQTLQNCTTMATSLAGGVYAYNLTTKATQAVALFGSTLVAGDGAVSLLNVVLPGALAPDGHVALVLNTASGSTTTPTLYSAYLPQIVTAVALTAPATGAYGGGVTLSAKVTPNTGAANSATGSVKFMDGTTVLGTQAIDSTGSASLSVSSLGAGTHSLQALYTGDALYEGAKSATSSLAVSKITPTLTLTSSLTSSPSGQPITLTAQTAGAIGYPTGSITFSAGSTTLGTGTIGATGTATLSVSTLPLGTDSITASYAGDANFNSASSTALTITVGTPDFSITASPASATITAGQSASFVFTVTPNPFGYNTPVTFSCGTLPTESACSFSPASVTPGGSTVTSTLTLTTTAAKVASNEVPALPFHTGGVAGVCFAVLFAWLPKSFRQKRRWAGIALMILLSAGAAGLIGCGGGSGSSASTADPGTTKGTATVNVSATSGTVSHTFPVTVTVQ